MTCLFNLKPCTWKLLWPGTGLIVVISRQPRSMRATWMDSLTPLNQVYLALSDRLQLGASADTELRAPPHTKHRKNNIENTIFPTSILWFVSYFSLYMLLTIFSNGAGRKVPWVYLTKDYIPLRDSLVCPWFFCVVTIPLLQNDVENISIADCLIS